ncbi:uncharacterized protein [Macaca nemestrina]|uniref:uncharacterized protein n=1 Tax=Macaca nemestrina TaxID=9545 RepID=UPI0005F53D30
MPGRTYARGFGGVQFLGSIKTRWLSPRCIAAFTCSCLLCIGGSRCERPSGQARGSLKAEAFCLQTESSACFFPFSRGAALGHRRVSASCVRGMGGRVGEWRKTPVLAAWSWRLEHPGGVGRGERPECRAWPLPWVRTRPRKPGAAFAAAEARESVKRPLAPRGRRTSPGAALPRPEREEAQDAGLLDWLWTWPRRTEHSPSARAWPPRPSRPGLRSFKDLSSKKSERG